MIELLFFFTACILTPMYEDVYCQIEIILVPSLNQLHYTWYKQTGNVTNSESMRAFVSWLPKFDKQFIWILEGKDGEYATQGCTVLWHELLHISHGYTNKNMPYCNWSENVNPTD